jgi:DNA-3-methyladenine glycosylase II
MKVYSIQGKLFPEAPFDFSKSMNFMNMFAPTSGEQTINDLSFTKAVYLEDQTLAFKLENEGTVEKPVLSYTLFAHQAITENIKSELLDRITFFLSLEDDLKPFYEHGMKDDAFKPVLKNLYGLHQVKFLTPFETAGWAILGQRISMKVAHIMKERLTQAVGDKITIDGVDYWTFPSAKQIKNLGVENLREILKNQRKSEYLMNVSESFTTVDEEFLRKAPLDEVKNWLLNIKGIGEWSAHLELIRGLGRMEEESKTDKMLIECAKNFYGSDIDQNIDEISEGYGEFKGYWAYYIRSWCSVNRSNHR